MDVVPTYRVTGSGEVAEAMEAPLLQDELVKHSEGRTDTGEDSIRVFPSLSCFSRPPGGLRCQSQPTVEPSRLVNGSYNCCSVPSSGGNKLYSADLFTPLFCKLGL